MKSIRLLGIVVASLATSALLAGDIAVRSGESIAFMGDSITAQGAGPLGYVTLVMTGLQANGVSATAIPAGISGHKSNQMLARLGNDVLAKKPAWMTLSCGVNDVWHGERGVPLEGYVSNITAIVSNCQAAGIKVVILTATMIKEDPTNALNRKLVAYNEFLRKLAREKDCRLADLNADMQAAVAAKDPGQKGNLLTVDGVHMNAAGNRLMAEGVLKALGCDEEQLKKAREAWALIKPPAPKPAAPKPAAQAPAKPAEQPVSTDVLPEKK